MSRRRRARSLARPRPTVSLLAAVLAAGAGSAVTPFAAAQPAQRGVMMMDDGQGVSVAVASMPDLDLLRQSRIALADLDLAARMLQLSETQRLVFERLVADHLERLAELDFDEDAIDAARRAMAGEPASAEEEGDGEEDDRDRMRNAVRNAVREAFEAEGLDVARLDNDEIGTSIGIGVSMDRESPGDPPTPTLDVTVGFEPEEGVTLSDEERAALQRAAERVAKTIEEQEGKRILEEMRQQAMGGPRDEAAQAAEADARMAGIHDAADRSHEAISDWLRDKDANWRRFVADAAAVLAESQMESWPGFEAALDRRRTLDWGELAGESLDLEGLLVEHVHGSPRVPEGAARIPAALEPTLAAVFASLDPALARRNALLVETAAEVDRGLNRGAPDDALRAMERLERARVQVRNANLRGAELIAAALVEAGGRLDRAAVADDAEAAPPVGGAPGAARFRQLVLEHAHPGVFTPGPMERMIRQLERRAERSPGEIPAEAFSVLAQVRPAWEAERAEAVRQWIAARERLQPVQRLMDEARVAFDLDPELEDRAQGRMGGDPAELRESLDRAQRRIQRADRRAMEPVLALLPEALRAELPPVPAVELEEPEPIRAEQTSEPGGPN